MNDDQHTTALHERVERAPDWPERDETPREGETSALARHRDPSLTKDTTEAAKKQRPGVEWVRPTDLMVSRSARVAGRGIDFQAELARRSRRVPGQAYRAARTGARTGVRFVSERARKLPPVTAFGRGSGEHYSWVSRSGIGLG
ncbi:hypothetical protein ABZ787_05205 [Micrococcus luteus]|mgnify:FL=1|jgi:hypothetical protein|uniref:hypothetical protein n=1 Tax=Micrococcales TaxID=85006 RepID=UPI0002EB7674|nr:MULTISPECIES: hypothetical protein [Micrococcales]OFT25764.1 hypothetical protein HMPREF3102_02205 [Micrococcus sp. HMSC30C05]MCK1800772.1 hypothetical protein [Micrococcus sp. XM4230B]MCK1812304.1 hypothetical protein [Micrococcus sp. XM4230A]MCM3481232.1 hypothetical protein [Micrococcus luteus]MCM3658514.1 hypothetical protein [Agromyces mediolanus]